MQDGTEYDLAPGLVPIMRPAKIPKAFAAGPSQIIAKDLADAQRVLDILKKKGINVEQTTTQRVSEKAPTANLKMQFDGIKLSRSLTKTALTAACVIYGNATVRRKADSLLCLAAKDGEPDIREFACWDYWNPWPTETNLTPHKRSSDPTTSGFEHAIYFADVAGYWVAYISLFGDFRFTIQLGRASDLRPAGLAVNPRGLKNSRFECHFRAPETFSRHQKTKFADQFSEISHSVTNSINAVLSRWQSESRSELHDQRDQELAAVISALEDDPIKRAEKIAQLLAKWATIDRGVRWQEELDSELADGAD